MKTGNIVVLNLQATTANQAITQGSTVLLTLPTGYRPDYNYHGLLFTDQGDIIPCDVDTDGKMKTARKDIANGRWVYGCVVFTV